jgi:F-type H+-transporting ATPase subunit b
MNPLVADAGLLDVNGTLIAEVIAFLLMLWVLAKWAYPPIIRIATEREQKIARALEEAERSRQEAAAAREDITKQLEEARAQAREIIAQAHKAAVTETEELVRKGRREAEAQIERARSEIAAERDKAIQEIRAQVGALVVLAATKVLGEAIDRKAHARLIDESLAEVDSVDGQRTT